jgi:hypothetical protein
MEINPAYTIQDVKQALSLADFDAYSAQKKMIPTSRESYREPGKPGQVRLGGVLVLLYSIHGELQLVLTRRRDDLNSHAGQMSFPGGQHEAQETLLMTALRETESTHLLPGIAMIIGPIFHQIHARLPKLSKYLCDIYLTPLRAVSNLGIFTGIASPCLIILWMNIKFGELRQ